MRTGLLTTLLIMSMLSFGVGLTLDEAVEKALSDNPALMSAFHRWEAAKLERTRVTGVPDPMIEFGFGSSGPDLDGEMEMIGISQMVPFPTKIIKSRSKADAAGMAAKLRPSRIYLGTQTLLIVEVTDARDAGWPSVPSVTGLDIERYGRPSVTRDLFSGTTRIRYQFINETTCLPGIACNL